MNHLRALAMALALTAPPALQAGLVGHWTFNGTFEDSSGEGNHGTPRGGAVLSDEIPAALGSGRSLELDGTGYVEVPHAASLDLPDTMTLAAWIRPVGNVGWDGIVAKNPGTDSNPNHAGNFEIRLNAGNRRLEFLCQQGGIDDTTGFNGPNSVIAEGEWTHIAITAEVIEYGDIRFYVNGVLADELLDALAIDFFPVNENPIYIGNRADLTTTPFNGFLDDVRIYDTVLSDVEIAALAEGTGTSLSSSRFSSALPTGSTIATIARNRPEEGRTYTFALVSGTGDDDNDKFVIEDNELRTGSHAFSDDEDGTRYSIRIEARTVGGGDVTADVFELILSGDSDSDGLPDAFEEMFSDDPDLLSGLDGADADSDGLSDLDEYRRIAEGYNGLDPTNADSDGDSLLDGEEFTGAGDRPVTNPVLADTDGDGLDDGAENNTGIYIGPAETGTNPVLTDSDGDGLDDLEEIDNGGNPVDDTDNAPADLIALWRFDGDDASDATGNGHDGEIHLAELIDDVPEILGGGLSARFGLGGTAVETDVVKFIEIPHHSDLDIGDAISLAAWVKPIGEGAWDGILAKNPAYDSLPNHAGNYEFRIHSSNRTLQFLSQRGGVDDTATFTGTQAKVPTDEWSHIAVTAQTGSGNLRYFVNGELVHMQSGAIDYETFPLNEEPVYIGNRADGVTQFDGMLDDVALFRGILTTAQIRDVMQSDFSGFDVGEPPAPADFSILDISANSDTGAITLVWESPGGGSFRVQASDDLDRWATIATVSAGGETTSHTEPGDAAARPVRFYRIVRE